MLGILDLSRLMARRATSLGLAMLLLAAAGAGCAYYNTFYVARKSFDSASQGQLYPAERPTVLAGGANYDKAINYSKALLSKYPKSKWVDDAYLLWARALIGKDDPLQAAEMLEKFEEKYPASSLKGDARFFLVVAYRLGRKFDSAFEALERYQRTYPKNHYAAYGWLERARVELARKHYTEASGAATWVMAQYRKPASLWDQALRVRAQSYFERQECDSARADYRLLERRAQTDDERVDFRIREADCLGNSGDHATEVALLQDQLAHEPTPPPLPTASTTSPSTTSPSTIGPSISAPIPAGRPADRRSRILLRLGSAYARAGQNDRALATYRTVVGDYAKQPVAAEAQFRIGYVYESYYEDFARARAEYAKVKEHAGGSDFARQADQRQNDLARIERAGGAASDSLSRQAEKELMTAEVFLFQHDKPERALEQYVKVARDYPKTAQAPKALNAAAWVLSRKLGRRQEADSLFWRVIYEYRGTEQALAARDYLEASGHPVADSLILLPVAPAPVDTVAAGRVGPPGGRPPEEPSRPPGALGRFPGARLPGMHGTGTDSARLALPDSLLRRFTPSDSIQAIVADSLRRVGQEAPK